MQALTGLSGLAGLGGGGVASPYIVHDIFTDSDGTNLAAHAAAPINVPGGSWINTAPPPGNLEISGNLLVHTVPGIASFYVIESGTNSPKVTVDLASDSAWDHLTYVMLRYVDGSNFWYVQMQWVQAAGQLSINEATGGSYVVRAVDDQYFSNDYTLHELNCEIDGETLTVNYWGREWDTSIDQWITLSYSPVTTHSGGTKVGLSPQGRTFQYDNFRVED